MQEATSFEQILRQQAAALAAALGSQAEGAGVSLPAELAERLGKAVAAGTPNEQDSRVVRERFRGAPPLALVAFDTPGVHDYVFRVRRPVDIAGGSHLVAAFTDRERAQKASIRPVQEVLAREGHHEGALVFAGGGRGLAVVARHRAGSLRTRIEAVLADATVKDLQTITAELGVWPEDLGPTPGTPANGGTTTSRYAAAVSVLMGRLARERSRCERFGETVEAKTRRCAACRRRPGTQPPRRTGEFLCPACARRRDLGGRLKRRADEATTFEDLVGEDDPRLAVLYADGANVGAAFQEIDSMARHRALSEAVERAFDTAVEEIRGRKELRKELQDADERQLYQMPIRGGDDAVLILPAPFAFAAATILVRSVEKTFAGDRPLLDAFAGAPQSLRRSVDHFGVGVGIVFADCHFPIGFLVRYAEELLKSAKRLIHERGGASGRPGPSVRSAVDYLLLASGNPLSESIGRLRETTLRIAPRGREPGLWLTERPLSIDALDGLLRDAEALRRLQPTQRFAVRQELFRGFSVSRSFWRYQHARAKRGEGWAQYREERGVALGDVDRLLWREAEPPPGAGATTWRSTTYLDALEALDLSPEPARSSQREGRR